MAGSRSTARSTVCSAFQGGDYILRLPVPTRWQGGHLATVEKAIASLLLVPGPVPSDVPLRMTTLTAVQTRWEEGRVEVGRGIRDQCRSPGEGRDGVTGLGAVDQRWMKLKHKASAW